MAAKLISDIQSGLTYSDYKKAFMNCDEVKNNTSLMGNFDDYWKAYNSKEPSKTTSTSGGGSSSTIQKLGNVQGYHFDGAYTQLANAPANRNYTTPCIYCLIYVIRGFECFSDKITPSIGYIHIGLCLVIWHSITKIDIINNKIIVQNIRYSGTRRDNRYYSILILPNVA